MMPLMRVTGNTYWTIFMILFGVLGCSKKESTLFSTPGPESTGLIFQNTLTPTDSLNILDYLYYYNGGGLAMGDLNNDGLPDLYFTANQGPNALYLNKGDLKFEDITESAGVLGKSDWHTGCIIFDANGDGFQDIYISAVVGINGFKGHNELYINNGDLTFTESAKAYGLAFEDFGTMSAILDYDQDGDLDLYILNHAVHTQESFGRVDLRYTRNPKTGDRLLRNDGNVFTDVSEQAGILGGINAYGLGISIADFDKDGWPDIYVGNDFHEDDYYYHNNQDGTFTEQLRSAFSHISRFSMGNDVADINNDGWPDLISLDMLPQSETLLKTSEGDDAVQTLKLRTQGYGYHYQYSRNMLFINQKGKNFSERALYSGVAATDWSWSALFGDYDLDGYLDLFISNGITRRPNNLDYIKFISSQEIHKQINDSRLVDQSAIEMMPSGAAVNFFYQGQKGVKFEDVSRAWGSTELSLSGASVLGDLDRDGDLDLVVNNTGAPAALYVNQSINQEVESQNHEHLNQNSSDNNALNHQRNSGLSISLSYTPLNPYAIGAKAYLYTEEGFQYREVYPVRGFQSCSEPLLHFALPAKQTIKGLKIIWPNGQQQWVNSGVTSGFNTLKYSEKSLGLESNPEKSPQPEFVFIPEPGNLGINYTHKEDDFSDFNDQKLIPYKVSDHGPAYLSYDFNQDGHKDILISGGKNQSTQIYTAHKEGFKRENNLGMALDSLQEFVDATVYNANGKPQLVLAAGGNSVRPSASVFENKIWPIDQLKEAGISLAGDLANTHVVRGYENLLFVGNFCAPQDFGKAIPSYIFQDNQKILQLDDLGMITDALWMDHNQDGLMDLLIIGHWMSPRLFIQTPTGFEENIEVFPDLKGLWQCVVAHDIDHDGDLDLLMGNWGLNSKLEASKEHPMKLWYNDFDQNGASETILTIYRQGDDYPLLGLDDLAAQMVVLRKQYTQYSAFANQPLTKIRGLDFDQVQVLNVDELASGYFENKEGNYQFVRFDQELQQSPITAFLAADFNQDQNTEILVGGNYFGVIPFQGRFDSFSGAVIDHHGDIHSSADYGLDLWNKSVRHFDLIRLNNQTYLIVIFNNETTEIYRIES
ncbi:VCBS repeat-containing protein [Flavobacteriaceae bacterium]|nr:VCBS repeat-containing protein [Flavobacteriaceae bacterium]